MIDEDLFYSSAADLTRLYKRRKARPVAFVESCLERIENLNPKLHAFVTVTHDLALKQAHQAEDELDAGLVRSPLHGVPFGVKDLFAVEGYPTTWGARPFTQQMINRTATIVSKLMKAGAILLGKCAMSELAGGPPIATASGACRTPWDLNRWSGGSSSGSGAAVAAGLVTFALGTETWGSIMAPASFCGVTGLRPTFGRVSRAGGMYLSWSMDKPGVLARSPRDCGEVLKLIHGADGSDPDSVTRSLSYALTRGADKLKTLRVGYVVEDYEKYGEKDVKAAFDQVLEIFRASGVHPEVISLPPYEYEAIASTIIAVEEASAFEVLAASTALGDIIDPARRGELLGGQRITAVDYLRCQRLRSQIQNDFLRLFESVDIILGSTTLSCAPPITATSAEIFPGGNSLEAAENLLGLPGISLPCGFDHRNLPIGFKIVASPFREGMLLEVGHAFQAATSWHEKRPRL